MKSVIRAKTALCALLIAMVFLSGHAVLATDDDKKYDDEEKARRNLANAIEQARKEEQAKRDAARERADTAEENAKHPGGEGMAIAVLVAFIAGVIMMTKKNLSTPTRKF